MASVRAFLSIGIPVGVAYSLISVQELTDRAVASRLGTGDVAALGYANRLFLLPFGFVIAALGPMVLGTLTSARAEAPTEVARTAVAQLRSLAGFLSPIGLAFAALGPTLISLVFEYGAFGPRSTELTTSALDGLSIGFSSVAISFLLLRAMQAVAQLRNLVVISLGTVIANAALSIALGIWLGLYGVTLATSLVALGAIVAQVALLGQTLGRAWARETYRAVWGPAVVTFVLSAGLISADRADVISQGTRIGAGLAAAALTAVAVLAQTRREGT
jgi:putative peptidoglycan lipid II flippase